MKDVRILEVAILSPGCHGPRSQFGRVILEPPGMWTYASYIRKVSKFDSLIKFLQHGDVMNEPNVYFYLIAVVISILVAILIIVLCIMCYEPYARGASEVSIEDESVQANLKGPPCTDLLRTCAEEDTRVCKEVKKSAYDAVCGKRRTIFKLEDLRRNAAYNPDGPCPVNPRQCNSPCPMNNKFRDGPDAVTCPSCPNYPPAYSREQSREMSSNPSNISQVRKNTLPVHVSTTPSCSQFKESPQGCSCQLGRCPKFCKPSNTPKRECPVVCGPVQCPKFCVPREEPPQNETFPEPEPECRPQYYSNLDQGYAPQFYSNQRPYNEQVVREMTPTEREPYCAPRPHRAIIREPSFKPSRDSCSFPSKTSGYRSKDSQCENRSVASSVECGDSQGGFNQKNITQYSKNRIIEKRIQ